MNAVARMNLEEAKAAWILGDWDRLALVQPAQLDQLADRELMALLSGAACLRLGQDAKGRRLIGQAISWGCPSRLAARVLVAGVHFSLGRAELLRHENLRSQQHVLAGIRSASLRELGGNPLLANAGASTAGAAGAIPGIDVADLGRVLGTDIPPPEASRAEFGDWAMARDDGPILRYLLAVQQPKRHLEFGTWQGWGTCLCLETTAATVWTLNLPDGEPKEDGSWAYSERVAAQPAPPGAVSVIYGDKETGPIVYHRTDAGSYIGWMYRRKGLGHRVCQILCDSRNWDISSYPAHFFDSVFIDGGHQTDVVMSDTRKALSVLRPGGMVIWHDFCPVPAVRRQGSVVGEVTAILEALLPEIGSLFSHLAWINPSMILFGIKR